MVVVSKLKPNGGAAGRLSPGPVLPHVKAMRGGGYKLKTQWCGGGAKGERKLVVSVPQEDSVLGRLCHRVKASRGGWFQGEDPVVSVVVSRANEGEPCQWWWCQS